MFRGNKKQDEKSRDKRIDFMSDEEMRMVDDYILKIEQNQGHMNDYYDEWEKIEEAYATNQELKDNRPNSRINIMNANIEGQIAALVEQNLDVVCRGEGPSDKGFVRWGEVGLSWTLRQNHIKKLLARHEGRREKFGPAWLKISWDPDAVNKFGLARITCPPLNRIFVDMKISDPLNLQDADYIAEVMPKSKTWAEEKFGDLADNIIYGNSDKASIFRKELTEDDEDGFFYVQLWTMTKGKLRLIEFSDDGVLLADSFKEWTGKRFKDIKDPDPFCRYNKLPYFLTIMYYEEGKLYGFGDGKLLRPLQDMINDLYDQIRISARPNRIFYDPNSDVELEDFDDDMVTPIPCNDPNQNIRVVEPGKVNPALWQLLNNIHMEVQRVTRFSELMLGQKSMTKTATEASIQQQQGSSATDHKKLMLQETLVDVCKYALDLMMENYTEGKAFRIDEDKDDYEWIDFRKMNEVPILVPPEDAFTRQFKNENPDLEMPKWMQLTGEEGEPVTKSVELDIEISIGAGMPRNKAFLYQMIEKLSQMVVEGRNVVSWQELRGFISEFLGIPLSDDDMVTQQQNQQMMQQQAMEAQTQQQPMQGAQVQGLSPAGNPMMSVLPGGGRAV